LPLCRTCSAMCGNYMPIVTQKPIVILTVQRILHPALSLARSMLLQTHNGHTHYCREQTSKTRARCPTRAARHAQGLGQTLSCSLCQGNVSGETTRLGATAAVTAVMGTMPDVCRHPCRSAPCSTRKHGGGRTCARQETGQCSNQLACTHVQARLSHSTTFMRLYHVNAATPSTATQKLSRERTDWTPKGTIVTLDLTRQDSHHLRSSSKLRHHARGGMDMTNTSPGPYGEGCEPRLCAD